MTSGVVLVSGLSGGLYIASQAIDADSTPVRQASAERILSEMMADLNLAIRFTERTDEAVTFTVPDRTGDRLPEKIRYAWSGTAGDPLVYQINGSAEVTLAEDVQEFRFNYLTRKLPAFIPPPPDGASRILFVIKNSWYETGPEKARISLFERWGYTVNTIHDGASQADFDTALTENDVVYFSEEALSDDIGTKITGATIGVVSEEGRLCDELGIASSSIWAAGTTIDITDNTHYITTPFALGSVALTANSQPLLATNGDLAPGLQNLGALGASPALVALKRGAEILSGRAAGRRVVLPWGDSDFNIESLNDDGLTMLRRSIEWAAGADSQTETHVVYEEFTENRSDSKVTQLAISTPPGTTEGDLLIAAVSVDAIYDGTPVAPSGWNLLDCGEVGSLNSFGVWWKLADADEPATHVFSWTDDEHVYGWMMRFTGHDTTNPIHAYAIDTGRSKTPESPSVTTTIDRCMILRIGGFDDDDITVDETGLVDHTTITMDWSNSGTAASSGGAGYIEQPEAGDSGTADFALTKKKEYRTVTIAITPDQGE